MAYKVIFNKRFAKKIVKISEYLEEKWSVNVAKEFLAKIDDKINSISENPDIGYITQSGIRRVILTKHNIIYYRVKDRKIILVNVFETKQHPQKNKYE